MLNIKIKNIVETSMINLDNLHGQKSHLAQCFDSGLCTK